MTDNTKKEFYMTVSPEQYARKGEDFFVGTNIHRGHEINVKLFDSDELKENGLNPINKGAYKRPEIADMIAGENSGKAASKILKKFEMLSSEQMKAMPNVKVPENLILKINTSVELKDNWVGSRWIDVLTGEGSEPFEMDNDIAVSANGLDDTGMYMQIVRPNKFRTPGNLFVEGIDVKNAKNATPENFSKSLIESVDDAIEMRKKGGMPMAQVMCIDANNKPVKFNFSYESNGETKNYQSTQFTVRTSAKIGKEWKNFYSGKDAVKYALGTENGKAIDSYLLDNPDTKIAIFPAASFMMGPNVKNKIINDAKDKERLTNLRFAPYEIDFGGKYPLQAYNKGQFSVRQGMKNKKSYYVTDVTTTDPFNKAISLLDMAKYAVGIDINLKDNIKTEKPEKPEDDSSAAAAATATQSVGQSGYQRTEKTQEKKAFKL